MAQTRNFRLGLGSEWTKEQRTAIDLKSKQGGKPLDKSDPLTWVGLFAPMFGTAYSFVMVWKLYIEKAEEEEENEKRVVQAITHRDPKLKIEDM